MKTTIFVTAVGLLAIMAAFIVVGFVQVIVDAVITTLEILNP